MTRSAEIRLIRRVFDLELLLLSKEARIRAVCPSIAGEHRDDAV